MPLRLCGLSKDGALGQFNALLGICAHPVVTVGYRSLLFSCVFVFPHRAGLK